MIKRKVFIFVILLAISLSGCKKISNIEKNFNYVIVFSDTTEYFFEIKNTPYIKNEILLIKDKDLETIKNRIQNVKKILLTHNSNNEILNNESLKKKIFNLSKVKFSLKKSIDFLLNDRSIDLKKTLLIQDRSLNNEDFEYLKNRTKEKNIDAIVINEKNISYIKNIITPKIETIILFSIKNNKIFLQRFSESPFFKKIKFVLIGNTRKDLNIIQLKYMITLKVIDLLKIVKEINENFKYEFNIYKR